MTGKITLALLLGAALASAPLPGTAWAEALSTEDQRNLAIDKLAAAIATAQSADEIADLVDAARQDGLTDEQIAFAFGVTAELASKPEIVTQAYESFLSAASEESESGQNVAADLSAAFDSGSKSVSVTPPDISTSSSQSFVQSTASGSIAFQGGDLGNGGGASPK